MGGGIEMRGRWGKGWRGEQMIISSPKYNVSEYHEAFYVTHLSLTIRNFSKEDVNTYRCVASNSLGRLIPLSMCMTPEKVFGGAEAGADTGQICKATSLCAH
ncbi:hypothetical protein C7M84_015095 [Penaeus vannamei]|uniref:Immunoglobulin I-set domain-containing protein n=1 Tax=Penaeus vannamei TaxID=6689 RepID=A0A423SRN6_PENVA|nr:hypothetical protein C7M84_015095 [Penaeus vannamei]